MLAVDTTFTLPNHMLRRIGRVAMFNSLNIQVSFLDIVLYALSLYCSYNTTSYKCNMSFGVCSRTCYPR